MWPEVKKTIDNNIRTGIRQYYTNPMARNVMDRMQKGLACCGSLSIMDWDSNDYYRLILLIYIYISNVHLVMFLFYETAIELRAVHRNFQKKIEVQKRSRSSVI